MTLGDELSAGDLRAVVWELLHRTNERRDALLELLEKIDKELRRERPRLELIQSMTQRAIRRLR